MNETGQAKVITVQYVLADTRLPIRGLKFTPEVLQSAASSFRPRPMYRNHRSEVIGRILTSECVHCDDGEWELRGTAEIDLPAGQSLDDFAGKGMSMSLIAYEKPLSGDEALIIAAEPGHFGNETFEVAQQELSAIVPGRVTKFYQFSELPPPTVVIVLLDRLVDLLVGASSSLLVMGIAELVEERFSRSSMSKEQVQIRTGLEQEEPSSVIDVAADATHEAVRQSIRVAIEECVPRLIAARAARRRGIKKIPQPRK